MDTEMDTYGGGRQFTKVSRWSRRSAVLEDGIERAVIGVSNVSTAGREECD